LPVALMAPLLGAQYALDAPVLGTLMVSLLAAGLLLALVAVPFAVAAAVRIALD